MSAIIESQTKKEAIAEKRSRYLCHTDNLMMVVIDFNDGPAMKPDAPHHHPHEQISYVAEGELIFFLGDEPHKLRTGDMITVAPNIPHCVQILSESVRLIDTFTPLREDFLE